MAVAVPFDGTWIEWRRAARAHLAAGARPERLLWRADGAGDAAADLFDLAMSQPPASAADAGAGPAGGAEHRVPRRFMQAAEAAAHHADPARWSLLYRMLWRITHGEPHLLEVEVDADVRRLLVMERAVRRASHKMKAFVRFRATGGEDDPYVAWFEPEHPVLECVAPFFARRFATMRWSVLTPDRCAHWDGVELRFTAGASRSAAPSDDALEELWRTYYANIFNPARLNARAMQAELPKMYWKNLPEAGLIERLRREAPVRARRMVAGESTAATEPALRPRRAPRAELRDAAEHRPPRTLPDCS